MVDILGLQSSTLPPPGYSTWNGYGMDGIHKIGYGFHGMGDGFHLHSIVIPPPFHPHSTFISLPFHPCSTVIPPPFHTHSTVIPQSFHSHSTVIPPPFQRTLPCPTYSRWTPLESRSIWWSPGGVQVQFILVVAQPNY